MMAVILRGQGFPGQLLTKVGKYDDVEPRSVWLRAMPLAASELRCAEAARSGHKLIRTRFPFGKRTQENRLEDAMLSDVFRELGQLRRVKLGSRI